MITPVGRKEWADVLSAKVERIYTEDGKGFIELSGSTERLGDFCYVYDGYGDEEFRKECFRDPRAPQEPMSREYINLDPVDFAQRRSRRPASRLQRICLGSLQFD